VSPRNGFRSSELNFKTPKKYLLNNAIFLKEAQICADWGDVDCEAAKLYYSGNNFDLYRIGSNFESKRGGSNSNYAEEDESVFHLQRAETSLHKLAFGNCH
jgi:hypothetical protein